MLSMVGESVARHKAYLSMTSEFVRMWLPGRLPIFKLLSRSAEGQKIGWFRQYLI